MNINKYTEKAQEAVTQAVSLAEEGEHDALLSNGWHLREWTARKGYALTDEAVANSASETLWCSPHCVPVEPTMDLFS